MAGRPKVRVERVEPSVVGVMRDWFGTAQNAYRNVITTHYPTYDNFLRAFKGQEVSRKDKLAIEASWVGWLQRAKSTEIPEGVGPLANGPSIGVTDSGPRAA